MSVKWRYPVRGIYRLGDGVAIWPSNQLPAYRWKVVRDIEGRTVAVAWMERDGRGLWSWGVQPDAIGDSTMGHALVRRVAQQRVREWLFSDAAPVALALTAPRKPMWGPRKWWEGPR